MQGKNENTENSKSSRTAFPGIMKGRAQVKKGAFHMMRPLPKTPIALALCLCALLCCLPALRPARAEAAESAQITLNVLSDLYYLPLSLSGGKSGETGQALRLSAESAPAVEEALSTVIQNHPEALILTGDLTNNGEQESAAALAKQLEKVEQAGIPVYVINGDCDVHDGGLSPSAFRSIFRRFGYDGADQAAYYQPLDTQDSDAVPGGLSYAVSPKEGVRLLMIDAESYNGGSSKDGAISDGLMDWILQQVNQARQNGETVVAGMHRPVLPHKSGSASTLTGVINNSSKTAQQLADAGLTYLFSGHMYETDVASYTSPAGSWLMEMATGSLVTYGAPIRTAVVEGSKITLSTESVKHITWRGKRIDYQAYLKKQLFSGTAFADYAMRFLDSELTLLESTGLRAGIERAAGISDLGDILCSMIQSALKAPITLDLGGKINFGSLTIRLEGADHIVIESSASFLLPPLSISISQQLIPMIDDLFDQINTQWLARDADGVSPLRMEIRSLLEQLCGSVLCETQAGEPFTLNDLLADMMAVHAMGREAPGATAAALLEQLNPSLTNALLSEQVLPALGALGQKMLDNLKLNTDYLAEHANALWKPALSLLSSMHAGTLMKLMGFSVEDSLRGALTEEKITRIGAAAAGFVSGFYMDTEGIDDQVDGAGVQYISGSGVSYAVGASSTGTESTAQEDAATVSQQAAPSGSHPVSTSSTARAIAVPNGQNLGESASPSASSQRAAAPTASRPAAPSDSAALPAILFMAAAAFAISDYRRW